MSACKSVRNAGPGGAIPGAWVGGCANTSTCAGIAMPRGVIPGTEVGGGMVVCACTGIAGPRSVIPGVTVEGATFTVEGALGFAHFPDRSPPAYGSL